MSQSLLQRLRSEIDRIPIVDSHSHVPGPKPTATSLDDILGYHYYTELAHSAGMPKTCLEQGFEPRERCRTLLQWLPRLANTAQHSWFVRVCRDHLGYAGHAPTQADADFLFDSATKVFNAAGWEQELWKRTKVEAVFLTNDFDDPLTGFDTRRYVPCLRTDDLVFHFHKDEVRARLAKATGIDRRDVPGVREAVGRLFTHFISKGAKACAISLPPDFSPEPVSPEAFGKALLSDEAGNTDRQNGLFWMLAEFCQDHRLPFDLMIGVNRRVYENGVFQGQDLFDRRTSLLQFRKLFNAFPKVVFPVSVLDGAQNQELASHAWIFPNVVAHGHWWYANIPGIITRDLRERLQAAPLGKLVGYYSDAYKLEFVLPKFAMFRGILSKVLAEDLVEPGYLTEEQAVAAAIELLNGNARRIFGFTG
jgi:glucuronate isomerase